MLLTKRLWGHYLFLGLIMTIPLVVMQIEKSSKKIHIIGTIISIIFIGFNFSIAQKTYKLVANRELTKNYNSIKTNTIDAIADCKRLGKHKIGINIQLYYQFNWYLGYKTNKIYSVDKISDLDSCDCYITMPTQDSIKSNYPNMIKNNLLNVNY